jgi:hypothetical protein
MELIAGSLFCLVCLKRESNSCFLGSLRYFACLDAAGANLHACSAALRTLYAYGLQVGIEATARPIISV